MRLALIAALCAPAPVAALELPTYDSESTCRLANAMFKPDDPAGCMADEAEALARLAEHWSEVPEPIQAECDEGQRVYNHPGPSYGGLAWCLDRMLLQAGRPSPFAAFVAGVGD